MSLIWYYLVCFEFDLVPFGYLANILLCEPRVKKDQSEKIKYISEEFEYIEIQIHLGARYVGAAEAC